MYLPNVMNGITYPPILYSKEPRSGPNNRPMPNEASTHPMYFSRSVWLKELRIAILDVELAPAPNPPRI